MANTYTTLMQVGLLASLMGLLPASLQAAGGPSGAGKTEVLPMTKAAPAVVVIEAADSEMESSDAGTTE